MKKLGMALFGVAMMVAPLAGCSSSSSKDDCGDIAKKACRKLYECGFILTINRVPVTEDRCVTAMESQAAANGWNDETCREEWKIGEDLACGDYLFWFNN